MISWLALESYKSCGQFNIDLVPCRFFGSGNSQSSVFNQTCSHSKALAKARSSRIVDHDDDHEFENLTWSNTFRVFLLVSLLDELVVDQGRGSKFLLFIRSFISWSPFSEQATWRALTASTQYRYIASSPSSIPSLWASSCFSRWAWPISKSLFRLYFKQASFKDRDSIPDCHRRVLLHLRCHQHLSEDVVHIPHDHLGHHGLGKFI